MAVQRSVKKTARKMQRPEMSIWRTSQAPKPALKPGAMETLSTIDFEKPLENSNL